MIKYVKNVKKEDVFELLATKKEVYALDYKKDTLANLLYMTVEEIHDILSHNCETLSDYVFFFVGEEER